MTVRELSDELQMSSRALYYLIEKDEIPHVRIGRSIRIYRPSLDKWRREQEKTSSKKGPSTPTKALAHDPEGSTVGSILD